MSSWLLHLLPPVSQEPPAKEEEKKESKVDSSTKSKPAANKDGESEKQSEKQAGQQVASICSRLPAVLAAGQPTLQEDADKDEDDEVL